MTLKEQLIKYSRVMSALLLDISQFLFIYYFMQNLPLYSEEINVVKYLLIYKALEYIPYRNPQLLTGRSGEPARSLINRTIHIV